MKKQEIKMIKIEDLQLWTENPRDPMDLNMSNADIIKRAVEDPNSKWNLPKLLKEMGEHYDFSELPTVVNENGKNIVYDGNRRIAVLMYLQNKDIYHDYSGGRFYFPEIEPKDLVTLKEIPCNVCDRNTALDNIERKHANSGSWTVLDREYFLHKHKGKPKSLFLMFEEATGLISTNKKLNQVFIRDEVLTKRNLRSIGFDVKGGELVAIYPQDTAKQILNRLVELIRTEKITTRTDKQKGTIRVSSVKDLKTAIEILDPEFKKEISDFDESRQESKFSNFAFKDLESIKEKDTINRQRRGKQTIEEQILFGGKLSLNNQKVQNLYSAIDDIYYKFKNTKFFVNKLPVLGMSLRLLLDVAARELLGIDEDKAYKKLMEKAKKEMKIKKEDKNFLVLTNSWLDEKENVEGIFSKYAHGNIPVDEGNLIKLSKIVGDILKFYFNKEK